nr:hypothetical protein Iba_chr10cCG0340 [Ipomoea batatas]
MRQTWADDDETARVPSPDFHRSSNRGKRYILVNY